MGVLASGANGALNILLARAHHQDVEAFNDLKEDESIPRKCYRYKKGI